MKKKSKLRRSSKPQRIPLFVYTDESGHTGENLFDENQPYFWTGTLISTNNLDKTAVNPYEECIALLGVQELHGHQLGVDGIKKIAPSLIKVFSQNNCKFVFTLIEKRYYAAISLAWLILDSDYNRGVGHFHSLISLFHRMLAINIVQGLLPKEIAKFWSAYGKKDLGGFVQILDNLRMRVCDTFPDDRGRELLMDAIDWAAIHPDEIMKTKRTSRESVNVFALLYILDGIREVTDERGKVYRFTHDEQKQFARSLRETYEMAINIRVKQYDSILGAQKFDRDPLAVCPIEFVPSTTSIGIQLIDVVLWLKRYQVEGGSRPLPKECLDLLDFVAQGGAARTFLYKELMERTIDEYNLVMSVPLSAEKEAKARARVEELEQQRLRRMASPSES